MLKPEDRLEEMELELPDVSRPLASYEPGVKGGGFLFVSGQIPRTEDESEAYENGSHNAAAERFPWIRRPVRVLCSGKVGRDVTIDEAYDAAQTCALKCLAVMRAELGDLSRVRRIIKVTGYVNADPDFEEHPRVIDGASDMLVKVFGEKGKHARVAVGMSSLPLGAAVEVEMIAEFDEE